jgi:signal transduction histidine kinase
MKESMAVLARYTYEPEAAIGGDEAYPWPEAGPLAQTLAKGQTVMVDREEVRKELANIDPRLRDVRVTAMMIVPLRIHGDLIGFMTTTRTEQNAAFTKAEASLAEAMAGYIAGAIENTRLVEQMQKTAVAEERNRLAQDLHDSVTQTMFSIAAIAETLPKVWERDPQTGREGLEALRQMTQGALSEMRMLLIELRPTALLEKSLGELLRQLTAAIGARSEMMITTTIVGDRLLPDDVQIGLYRIAQEALHNVTKHSASTQARLGYYGTPEQISLQISDNGQGFDPQQQNGGRFGLAIMAERAQEIGAEFRLKSQPGEGTEVSVVWNSTSPDARRRTTEGES